MRKYLFSFICILLCMAYLTGCSSNSSLNEDDYDETVIAIDEKGRVDGLIIESFNKDYYSLEELKASFDNEIDNVNANKDENGTASLKDIKLENGTVYVKLNFSSTKAYEAFTNKTLFSGTIGEAYSEGYDMGVNLKSTSTDEMVGKVELMGKQDSNIIIMDEHIRLRCYAPVEYVSANVELINENEVRVLSEASGLAYIVLSK